MADAGRVTISREKKLGLVPFDRVGVVHPEEVRAVQDQARSGVVDGAPPEALTDELAMAVFAVELELSPVWSKEDRRNHRAELTAYAARYDALVPGLRKALRDSYLASRAVGGGWSA
ncbi:GPP34 family phosphoprotein [Streptomyces venezuelae ATCC 10712]